MYVPIMNYGLSRLTNNSNNKKKSKKNVLTGIYFISLLKYVAGNRIFVLIMKLIHSILIYKCNFSKLDNESKKCV